MKLSADDAVNAFIAYSDQLEVPSSEPVKEPKNEPVKSPIDPTTTTSSPLDPDLFIYALPS